MQDDTPRRALSTAELDAERYAHQVLSSCRSMAELALQGHIPLEQAIEWLHTFSVNARLTYDCARRAA